MSPKFPFKEQRLREVGYAIVHKHYLEFYWWKVANSGAKSFTVLGIGQDRRSLRKHTAQNNGANIQSIYLGTCPISNFSRHIEILYKSIQMTTVSRWVIQLLYVGYVFYKALLTNGSNAKQFWSLAKKTIPGFLQRPKRN